MEAVERAGRVVAIDKKQEPSAGFVPALPTLWPHMLVARNRPAPAFPFEAPATRFYYFGRNAVWTLAKVLQLDQGEVLVPAYHHGVEIEALLDAGVTVRFYPVGPKMQVDPDQVARMLGPRTRAVYLIHYLGFPGPTAALRELCDARGLALVEDCALSLLSKDGDVPLGSVGDAAVFSLYKTLPVPNGGALVLRGPRPRGLPTPADPPMLSTLSHAASSLLQNLQMRGGSLGRLVRVAIRGVGHASAAVAGVERVATGTQHFERDHANLGMSGLSRRIARGLDFASIVEARRRNYFLLLSRLRDVSPPVFSELPPGVCPLFYPLRVADKASVMAELLANGVETVDFWRYGHPSCLPGEFPDVDSLRRTILEVPIHQDLSPTTVEAMARAVRKALGRSP